jgi:uncharacterized protein
MPLALFLGIGVGAGVLAGLFGVGGGLVIVPALTLFAGYSQKTAAGTSLVALLLPVGLAGAYAFYQQGAIGWPQIKAGLFISVGMFFGSYLGARVALLFPDYVLKRAFALFLVGVAVRLWLQGKPA